MKKNQYIQSDGILKRKENTLYFKNEEVTKPLPIQKIKAIYCYGQVTISSQVINLLTKNNIPIHFFNYYGYYNGTYYPRETTLSGKTIIKQAEYYIDHEKRIFLAKKFIEGSQKNMTKVLSYYKIDNKINQTVKELKNAQQITEIMNVEGRIRAEYYQKFKEILPESFKLEKRVKNPPDNMINALISFGNSLLYTTALTQIYNTHLNPTISYLHEPSERRYSLTLDITEIFKPIIVDRLIFSLINKKIITEKDFNQEINSCLLNKKGQTKFIENYNKKMKTTVKHKELNRNVSYEQMIKLELYKLEKHILGMKKYEPFVMWW